MKRETLDPYWHKARIAARIWLKAQTRPLSARDRRIARALLADKGVTNRLIEQATSYWRAPFKTGAGGIAQRRVCHVVGC